MMQLAGYRTPRGRSHHPPEGTARGFGEPLREVEVHQDSAGATFELV